MPETEKETPILTAQEVAEYLRLDVATIYRLAQEGGIPAAKVGRTWRFRKDIINEWFRQQADRPTESRNGKTANPVEKIEQ